MVEGNESCKFSMDFRFFSPQDAGELGVVYHETKQCWITLHRHESIQHILDTIIHESLHIAIMDTSTGANNESEDMNMEQEHELMKRVIWCNNDWVF
jgi:hypothetical protein